MIKYSVNDDSYEVDKLLIAALDGETVWIHFHGELSALNISTCYRPCSLSCPIMSRPLVK